MRLKEDSIKGLAKLYWLARKARLLDTAVGQRAFSASYFLYKRYLEDPYWGLVLRHPEIFHGGNILDIGANIGYTATVFSRAVSPEFKVYAFEPESFNYRLLERSAHARKTQSRIVPILSAVGDCDGIIELWENQHHHADHRILTDPFRRAAAPAGTVAVPIMQIDSFVEKQPTDFPVRFIKVDVQGYVLPVCKGMEQTLAKNPRGILSLEFMPSAMRELGFQPEELITWLRQRGYSVYTIEKDGSFQTGISALSGGLKYCDLLFSREDLGD